MLTVPPGSTYHPGRNEPVELVVLHTAQCPCEPGRAESVMRYLARDDVQASAHYCCDPSATVAGVAEKDTAWAAPNANANGIHIEQAAYAEFGSGRAIPEDAKAARDAYGSVWPAWTRPEIRRMIREQVVPLVVGICQRWQLPPVLLSAADVAAGRKGITDHVAISRAFGTGDHWDCGENYPLAEVVAMVAAQMIGGPVNEGDEVPGLLCNMSGSVFGCFSDGIYRAISGPEFAKWNGKVELVAHTAEEWKTLKSWGRVA